MFIHFLLLRHMLFFQKQANNKNCTVIRNSWCNMRKTAKVSPSSTLETWSPGIRRVDEKLFAKGVVYHLKIVENRSPAISPHSSQYWHSLQDKIQVAVNWKMSIFVPWNMVWWSTSSSDAVTVNFKLSQGLGNYWIVKETLLAPRCHRSKNN